MSTAQEQLSALAQQLELPVVLSFHGADNEIVKVRINRPKQLNCIQPCLHNKFDAFWTKFEQLAPLRVAILTGTGRIFCAGADLKAWLDNPETSVGADNMNTGFLGISNRSCTKPIIAALNGSSYGGGTETLVNCDLVVAVRSATISLPEVRRGVAAVAGALPRLGRNLSLQRANQLALIGEPITAATAEQWGLVNALADSVEELDALALKLAAAIVKGAPESVFVSQRGVRKGYEETALSLDEATDQIMKNEMVQLQKSDNYIEGLTAFTEKRNPKWTAKI